MSGICGVLNEDGTPLPAEDLTCMLGLLGRRGPDRSGAWQAGPIGLGHTLLATTPEAEQEQLPLEDRASGCVITADARLDDASELSAALGRSRSDGAAGDGELILEAYLAWGIRCVDRLEGDFAFAIWDPRRRQLFCARDRFGVRPFYYHQAAGRFLAFASEPKPILALPRTPYRLNEARIADFLITELEGIDRTSTFFEEVHRLPPAHTLTLTREGVRIERYWSPQPAPELCLGSDQAYAGAFLEVFQGAVQRCLRGAASVGAMLSGGVDSGSVVAVARQLRAAAGEGPLPTFSAISTDADCVESRTIRAALTMSGLEPFTVDPDHPEGQAADLLEQLSALDEPHDLHMILPRALYGAARDRGIKALLDGLDGDTLLASGSQLARLLRRGRLLAAWRDASGENRFWGGLCPPGPALARSAARAFLPARILGWRRGWRASRRSGQRLERSLRTSIIDPAFARRIGLVDRLQALDAHRPVGPLPDARDERARALDHPFLTVGLERYGRVAAALGVEPRHPFLDARLVAFCLALPGEQMLGDGWPKLILRRAMTGRLPEAVRWRLGKEHLGWRFTSALMARQKVRLRAELETGWPLVAAYLDRQKTRAALEADLDGDMAGAERILEAVCLLGWLRRQAERPRATTGTRPRSRLPSSG